MEILIEVENQKLKIKSNLRFFAPFSQNFVKFKFNLDSSWSGLRIFAQFSQNGVGYNKFLDSNNSVYLPPEIGEGYCDLILYGSKDSTIATSNYLTLFISKEKLIYDSQSTDISESLYNQLVKEVDTLGSRLTNILAISQPITDADAELVDIRTAYDGKTYRNAGDSVRNQFKSAYKEVATSNEMNSYLDLL